MLKNPITCVCGSEYLFSAYENGNFKCECGISEPSTEAYKRCFEKELTPFFLSKKDNQATMSIFKNIGIPSLSELKNCISKISVKIKITKDGLVEVETKVGADLLDFIKIYNRDIIADTPRRRERT